MVEGMNSLMVGINHLRSTGPQPGPDGKVDKKDMRLWDACNQFESIMTSLILKTGLQSAKEMGKVEGEESDQGSETYQEIANEQMANFMGRQGLLGLGKMLYNNVKQSQNAMTQGQEDGQPQQTDL